MKRDDIINLMQQACDPDKKPAWHNGFWTITQLELDLFVDLVLKAERKPLTDDEILDLYFDGFSISKLNEFARAIERAHGIGGEE
jgi:ferric-dicitrate binding protein FerR (iron transport regulator)